MNGNALFGVPGLTPGGFGIWVALFTAVAGVAGYWVKGMADRKRAANEGVTVESQATVTIIKNLQSEVERMGTRIKKLEDRVDELETENKAVISERDAALADNARLKAINLGQGQVRQEAATIVAIERVQDDAARKAKQ